ncbi:hypothetical protein WN944_014321 [Citrus x changshan-huyou]|uniref:Uncharacterized protein n=1 Tax=Citrus x changshan-huyou TaxID=2935761 RepID=A0AAP0M5L8_9ROSI
MSLLEKKDWFEATLSYILGGKSDTVLAGRASEIATAEEEAVDSVRVRGLACCGVVETPGESIAAVGVSGQRREEKIEIGLESAVSGESCCIWAKMSKVIRVSCSCETQKIAYKTQKQKDH